MGRNSSGFLPAKRNDAFQKEEIFRVLYFWESQSSQLAELIIHHGPDRVVQGVRNVQHVSNADGHTDRQTGKQTNKQGNENE